MNPNIPMPYIPNIPMPSGVDGTMQAGPGPYLQPRIQWPIPNLQQYTGGAYHAIGGAAPMTGTTTGTTTTGNPTDDFFMQLSTNVSNDIIGHFMAVLPAIMTLFGILMGVTVIVVIYRFLTAKL